MAQIVKAFGSVLYTHNGEDISVPLLKFRSYQCNGPIGETLALVYLMAWCRSISTPSPEIMMEKIQVSGPLLKDKC